MAKRRVAVVGAGPAGCVVAARLADAGHDVTLFEAGGDQPAFDPTTMASTFNGGSPRPYLRGLGLGGGSAVNAGVQMWGSRDDYNSWERDHGCVGWNWVTMSKEISALGFPAELSRARQIGAFSGAVLTAADALGAPRISHVSETRDGAGPVALSLKEGARHTTFAHYVESRRDSITVRTDARVESVGIEDGVATSVVLGGDAEEFFDGVVLCAGTAWSPILVRRSGVVRAGLGRHLKDHPSVALTVQLRQALDGGGPTDRSITSLVVASSEFGDSDINILPMNHVSSADPNVFYALLAVAVTCVESEGSVHEVDGTADITLGSLSTDDDASRMVAALRLAEDLLAQQSLKDVVLDTFVDERGTTFEMLMAHDSGSIVNFARRWPGPYSHAVGTCRMGSLADDDAVVDPNGAVHGIRGLWIADASVFPDLPRAATQIPVMAVASRLGRIIAEGLA
jgi:choline dehydrogenase-like flavoprotein